MGEFFVIEPSLWGGGGFPRLEIGNKDRLRIPGTYMVERPNGDPNQYPERPHLVHVARKRGDCPEISRSLRANGSSPRL